jgi:hypothetical protein
MSAKKQAEKPIADMPGTPVATNVPTAEIQAEETLETAPIEAKETLENASIDSIETIEVVNPITVKGNMVAPSKYVIDEGKIDAYLNSVKQADTVVQSSRGGNFVSTRNQNIIYIPLSLIKG